MSMSCEAESPRSKKLAGAVMAANLVAPSSDSLTPYDTYFGFHFALPVSQ